MEICVHTQRFIISCFGADDEVDKYLTTKDLHGEGGETGKE